MTIVVNTRCLLGPVTGVQRYTSEVLKWLPGPQTSIGPGRLLRGHVWEQFLLPFHLQGRLLWSPANTGPLSAQRQVLTVHDIAPIDHPEWFSRNFAACYQWLWPRLLPRVRHIIADSEHTRRRVIDRFGIDSSRVSAVHLGVDARFAAAKPMLPAHLVQALGPRPFVLAVGSLEPRKNLPRLIEAWKIARSRLGAEWRLVIAGGANPRVFAERAALQGDEQVVWAGRIADAELPGLYAAATIFAYPSLYEGFGLPPLEAMAAGVPVLASGTTSLPEAVGDAALLVDPTSTAAIADALTRLADDTGLRAKLIEAGRQRAAMFTWERCAKAVWTILCRHDT